MINVEIARKSAARIVSLAIEIGFPPNMTIEVGEEEDRVYAWVRTGPDWEADTVKAIEPVAGHPACSTIKKSPKGWTVSFQKKYYQNSDYTPEGKDFSRDDGRFFYGLCEALGQLREDICNT